MENEGMPIYYDETKYFIADTLDEKKQVGELYPWGKASQKLFACLECMKDIEAFLESIPQTKALDKRRRKIKILYTPLYSFVIALVKLMNEIQNNPDTKNSIPEGVDSIISEIERKFAEVVPHGRDQLLRLIRNKMSAHFDTSLYPHEARKMFLKSTEANVGLWLHACITVLADLLKLPIYSWYSATEYPNCFGIVSPSRPFLTVMETSEDGRAERIVGAFIIKQDPKTEVQQMMFSLVEKSQWMFGRSDPQVRFFKEDEEGEVWSKSLNTLDQIIDYNSVYGKNLPQTNDSKA